MACPKSKLTHLREDQIRLGSPREWLISTATSQQAKRPIANGPPSNATYADICSSRNVYDVH